MHTAGLNVCFMDGSVRTLRYGNTNICPNGNSPASIAFYAANPTPLDWFLLMSLVGRKDGIQRDTASILD